MGAIYLAAYLASHVWLSGSVLLPCMLLVRWWAAKWEPSCRLATSKKHWILNWAYYGLAETALFSVLLLYWWHQEHLEIPPFESLGWAWMPISALVYAFHVRCGDVTEFTLGLSLRAVSEAAIDAGLAGIAWWVYGFLSRPMATQKRAERYLVCVLIVACGLGIANNSYFWRTACSDCFAPHGVPFKLFHEGGFAGGEGFVWMGVLEDTTVALIVALVSGLVWNRLAGCFTRSEWDDTNGRANRLLSLDVDQKN
jgi:hypothetical protein